MSSDESLSFNFEMIDFINLCLEVIQTANGEYLTQTMSPEDFWRLGYLQEANRRFFHPLGIALTAQIDEETGEIRLGQILDGRHDLEGIRFTSRMMSIVKTERIDAEWKQRAEVRMKALGYIIQPVS